MTIPTMRGRWPTPRSSASIPMDRSIRLGGPSSARNLRHMSSRTRLSSYAPSTCEHRLFRRGGAECRFDLDIHLSARLLGQLELSCGVHIAGGCRMRDVGPCVPESWK